MTSVVQGQGPIPEPNSSMSVQDIKIQLQSLEARIEQNNIGDLIATGTFCRGSTTAGNDIWLNFTLIEQIIDRLNTLSVAQPANAATIQSLREQLNRVACRLIDVNDELRRPTDRPFNDPTDPQAMVELRSGDTYEEYLRRMENRGTWGGQTETIAAVQAFNRNARVYNVSNIEQAGGRQTVGVITYNTLASSSAAPLRLIYRPGHYDAGIVAQ